MPAQFETTDDTGAHVRVVNDKDKSSIVVYRQGAHLTSWKTADGAERLYTSPTTVYKPGKAIRGGVPLIFPQFSDMGPLKQSHGFLRTSDSFTIAADEQKGDTREVTFECRVAEGGEPTMPTASFVLRYTVAFSADELELRVSVTNTSAGAPLDFSFAFHSYFAVAAIGAVRVVGLDETSYLDNLQERKPCPPAPVGPIDREVDRIYICQGDTPVLIHDGEHHTLTITGRQLPDAVLWNPWIEKAKGMSDLPDEDYHKFLCVEHGNIVKMKALLPTETWEAAQNIVSKRS